MFFSSLHLRKCIVCRTLLTIISEFQYQKPRSQLSVTSLPCGTFSPNWMLFRLLAEFRLFSAVSTQTQTVDRWIAKVSLIRLLWWTQMWQRMFCINLLLWRTILVLLHTILIFMMSLPLYTHRFTFFFLHDTFSGPLQYIWVCKCLLVSPPSCIFWSLKVGILLHGEEERGPESHRLK